MSVWIKGGGLLFFTLISAFISGSDAAFFSLPRHQVWTFKTDEKRRAVYSLLKSPKHLLVILILFNLFAEITIQQIMAEQGDSLWETIVIPFIFIVCCGEILPKAWGLKNNISVATKVAEFFVWCQKKMMPLLNRVVHLSSFISDRLFWFVPQQAPLENKEFQAMLSLSEKNEVLTKKEVMLIQQLMQVKEMRIASLMISVSDCFFIHEEKPLLERHELIEKNDYCFYPIKRKGKWLGIATKEQAMLEKTFSSNSLENYSLPIDTSGYDALKKTLNSSKAVAWVVNEEKEVVGVLTQQLLFDALVGNNKNCEDE